MTAPVSAPSLLEASDVERERALAILGDAVAGADDGELFLERAEERILRVRRRTAEVGEL